jgi:hypothetical protein
MIYVLNKFQDNPYPGLEIDTTSRGNNKDLSPFYLGPISAYNGTLVCNVENLWQYSKVYPEHTRFGWVEVGNPMIHDPLDAYYAWRAKGWATKRAVRYPMGKGAKPLYSLYNNHKLDYVMARKLIYMPAYASAVIKTKSYQMLFDAVMRRDDIVLRDFDGYDYGSMGMTLVDVANNPKKTMGHGFVLAMLLTGEIHKCMEV